MDSNIFIHWGPWKAIDIKGIAFPFPIELASLRNNDPQCNFPIGTHCDSFPIRRGGGLWVRSSQTRTGRYWQHVSTIHNILFWFRRIRIWLGTKDPSRWRRHQRSMRWPICICSVSQRKMEKVEERMGMDIRRIRQQWHYARVGIQQCQSHASWSDIGFTLIINCLVCVLYLSLLSTV